MGDALPFINLKGRSESLLSDCLSKTQVPAKAKADV